MRVSFTSSHVTGDFSPGALTVRIEREDGECGTTRLDEIAFDVPANFHTHNDSVAAALMTLIPPTYRVVAFNFPVSVHCATLLREHYRLAEVGPFAPDLEPRQRGRYLGLLLSGGLDSLAVWLVLRRVLGDEFKVVTSEFGGGFAFEEGGYRHFHRHVSCRTNFRWNGYGHGHRFVAAVPLLFADYADLGAIVTGHHYAEAPMSIESLRDGSRPAFLAEDLAVQAGGLDEVHIVRCLSIVGPLMLDLHTDASMLEATWEASGPIGSNKRYTKGLIFQLLCERQRRPFPPWLQSVAEPRRAGPFAGNQRGGVRFNTLYLMKHFGIEVARPMISDIDQYDFAFLDDLSMQFMERYNTNLSQYIPDELRSGILAVFHEAGIQPFDERDWEELERLRSVATADRLQKRAAQVNRL